MVTRLPKEPTRKVPLTVTINRDILEELRDKAWGKRKTLSRLVNDIMEEWLDEENGVEKTQNIPLLVEGSQ